MRGVVTCGTQGVQLLCTGHPEALFSPRSGRGGFVAGVVQVGFLPKGIPGDLVHLLSSLSAAESADSVLVLQKQEYS